MMTILAMRYSFLRAYGTALLAVMALSVQLRGQPAAPAPAPINVASLGPQVGQQVPDFSLVDQNGKTWTRDSIVGPKGAMLVFFRSADW